MQFLYKKLPLRLTILGVSVIIFLMCGHAQRWKEPRCGVFIQYFKEDDICQQKRIIQFPKLVQAR